MIELSEEYETLVRGAQTLRLPSADLEQRVWLAHPFVNGIQLIEVFLGHVGSSQSS
jgi:hypothetical protein